MRAHEVIAVARQWVADEGCREEGFLGAHLVGSLASLPGDVEFSEFSDVDIGLVVAETGGRKNQQRFYRGVCLEIVYRGLDEYATAEAVLANPVLAAHFLVDGILADPRGLLAELRRRVPAEYTRRSWVLARCEQQEKAYRAWLLTPRVGLVLAMTKLAGLIAVADLRMPTHRKALVMMREVLAEQDRLDLYEKALQVLGFASLTREQVESCLVDAARAFDRAVAVHRTPFELSYKLHAHLRPYLVEGARELIDAGDHRESMLWIFLAYAASIIALENDGSAADQAAYGATFEEHLARLGLATQAVWRERLLRLDELAGELSELAELIVEFHPDIID